MSSSTSARRRSASAKSGSARSSRPSRGACTRSCATSASSPGSAAKLSPFDLAQSLTPEEVARLTEAIDSELERGLALRERGAKDAQVYRVHKKLHEPCHVCGTPIERVDFEEHTIFYCPQCQTSGRLLKDRRLSRLLR